MLKKILQYILVFSLLMPLVLDLRFFQPYVTGKTFWLATWLLVAFPLVVYFLFKQKNIWRSRLVQIVLIFFLGTLLINLFSLDILRSWWGDWARMDGLVYFWLWLVFFFGLIFVLDNKKNWLDFLRINQLVVLVLVIIALGQISNIVWLADDLASRVFSLIGNANFLAHYLLLSFWLSIFLIFFDKKNKYWHLALSLATIVVIYLTYSRAAVLALALTVLVAIAYFIIKIWQRNRIKAIGTVLILLVLLSALPLISQRYQTFSWSDTTVKSRLVAWQAGGQGFLDRPILGWGQGNFQIVFNKYVDFSIYQDSDSRLWFDKAHNQFVDHLVEQGMIGFILYLLFLLVPFFYLKKIKAKYSSKLSLPLTLGLIANIIFLLFNFDTPVSYLLYFIYLSLIYWLSNPLESKQTTHFNTSKKIVIILSIIFSLSCLFYLVYLPVKANLKTKQIFLSQNNQLSWPEVDKLTKDVTNLTPQYQVDVNYELGRAIIQANWPIEEYIDSLQALAVYSQTASQQHLLDAKLHYLVANTYLYLGSSIGSIDYLIQALNYYEKIIPQLTPADRPDMLYNLAQTYYELSLLDSAQADYYYQQALDLVTSNAQKFPEVKEAQEKLEILLNS